MLTFFPERRPLPVSELTGKTGEVEAELTGQAGEVEAADEGESTANASGPTLGAQAVLTQASTRPQE